MAQFIPLDRRDGGNTSFTIFYTKVICSGHPTAEGTNEVSTPVYEVLVRAPYQNMVIGALIKSFVCPECGKSDDLAIAAGTTPKRTTMDDRKGKYSKLKIVPELNS